MVMLAGRCWRRRTLQLVSAQVQELPSLDRAILWILSLAGNCPCHAVLLALVRVLVYGPFGHFTGYHILVAAFRAQVQHPRAHSCTTMQCIIVVSSIKPVFARLAKLLHECPDLSFQLLCRQPASWLPRSRHIFLGVQAWINWPMLREAGSRRLLKLRAAKFEDI